ncbi:MAG: hypothetical protein ABSF28_12645 [Terracidiphilus sp.]|jgi:hypothetical protein
MSLLIASRDSLIRGPSWLIGYKCFDFQTIYEGLATNLENPEPTFLDQSIDGLPGYPTDASGFRL